MLKNIETSVVRFISVNLRKISSMVEVDIKARRSAELEHCIILKNSHYLFAKTERVNHLLHFANSHPDN